ncbi:alkylphosphonate utilization protein, partial [Kitasatospora sp. NPDC059722]
MSDNLPPCPQCSSEYTYEMNALMVCPECGHEWVPAGAGAGEGAAAAAGERVIKDAVGHGRAAGDTRTRVQAHTVKG